MTEPYSELPESNWVKNNRANYEANGRSLLKEQLARQAVEEYDFAPTGDPEMDIIIGMGLKDMREDDECDYSTDGHGDELVSDEEEVARGLAFFKSRIDFQSFPQAVKTADAEGPGAGSTNETKTSKQLKRQRQRQRAKEKKRLESQK